MSGDKPLELGCGLESVNVWETELGDGLHGFIATSLERERERERKRERENKTLIPETWLMTICIFWLKIRNVTVTIIE